MDRTTWRRLCLLAVLAIEAVVPGQSDAFQRPAGPASDPARSRAARPFVVDIRDYGARGDGKTDDTAAIQLAIDTIAARLDKLPGDHRGSGVVLIPATPASFRTSRPIWVDHPYLEIRGEGAGSRVEAYATLNHPLFVFGLRRVAKIKEGTKDVLLVADARYRPDLFGRLDASAAPAPRTRWGFRSRGHALIQAMAGPMSDGARHSRQDWSTDHWTEAPALTIEAAVEVPGATLPAGLPLFGMGLSTSGRAYPFIAYVGEEGQVVVMFSTQSEPYGPRTLRQLRFHVPPGKGVRRIAAQIDLKTARVSAYVDGTQVAVLALVGDDFKPGLRFAENDYYPLLIGDAGGDHASLGAALGIDWVLYGLLFSRSSRYIDDGPGRPQRRADKAAARIDDQYRYFTPPADDPGHVGHLAFTDDPALADRVLTIQGGPAANGHKATAFLHHSLSNNQGGIVENAIRDVHLVGGHLYGQNIAVAQVLDLKITGVRSTDAYHAVGSISHGANYTVRLEDCTLGGSDSGYFGFDQMLWARNITFASSGRVTMRFVGSIVKMENAMVAFAVPGNQATIKMHSGDYGGNYSFDHLVVDYEGAVYEQAAIYCETHPYCAATSLRLRDVLLGSVGDKVPILMLRDVPPHNPSAFLFVENLQALNKTVGAVVDVDSPAWRGEVRGVAVGEGPRIRYRGKPGTTSGIVVQE